MPKSLEAPEAITESEAQDASPQRHGDDRRKQLMQISAERKAESEEYAENRRQWRKETAELELQKNIVTAQIKEALTSLQTKLDSLEGEEKLDLLNAMLKLVEPKESDEKEEDAKENKKNARKEVK